MVQKKNQKKKNIGKQFRGPEVCQGFVQTKTADMVTEP